MTPLWPNDVFAPDVSHADPYGGRTFLRASDHSLPFQARLVVAFASCRKPVERILRHAALPPIAGHRLAVAPLHVNPNI